MNLLETLKDAQSFAERICDARCNAEYNPCEAQELANNLKDAIAELEKVEPVACVNCGGTCEQFFCDTYKDKFDYQSHPAPAVPEEQWITELRYELMKSKMTHNFTFSRNEVIALLNAAPEYKGEEK